MNRTLAYLNLAGVLLLGALCLSQWQASRRHTSEERHFRVRLDAKTATLRDCEQQAARQAEDLEALRQHVSRLGRELQEVETRLKESSRAAADAGAERDQWRAAADQWAAAVTARD
jgi:predicted  nucleic acid-binding Zn-ribbon protein